MKTIILSITMLTMFVPHATAMKLCPCGQEENLQIAAQEKIAEDLEAKRKELVEAKKELAEDPSNTFQKLKVVNLEKKIRDLEKKLTQI